MVTYKSHVIGGEPIAIIIMGTISDSVLLLRNSKNRNKLSNTLPDSGIESETLLPDIRTCYHSTNKI
ncbi:hypothetical protein SFRURICE_004815 [Spodoptera frugiperda]|nr:hypothetical protein SFRURICE_004815 [Spodoptera frugiperda]